MRLMSEDQVRRLPIVDSGKLVGMVSLGDMARNSNCEMEAAEALTEISSNIRGDNATQAPRGGEKTLSRAEVLLFFVG